MCPALRGVLLSDAEQIIPPLVSAQAHTPTYHWNLPWKVTKIEIKIFLKEFLKKKILPSKQTGMEPTCQVSATAAQHKSLKYKWKKEEEKNKITRGNL